MKRFFPFLLLILVVCVFFYKSIFLGLIPMPGDFVLGVYYPWLDYKWGQYTVGVPVKNPLLADVPSLFYPLKIYSTQILKSGHVPLWNPLLFNGYPLLATFQSSVFNPFNVFFLFLKDTLAWTLFIAAQPLLASLFMYLFLRELKLSLLAGILGAIVYAFSGFSLIWLEYGIHGYVMAYIPLLLFLVSRFLISPRPAVWGAFISVTVALQIFSGYPQVSLYTLILVPLWTISKSLSKTITICIFLGLGLTLSSIQILPGLELLHHSQRLGEEVSGGTAVAFLPWSQALSLLAPDYFGNPSTGNFWGEGNYTNNSGYIGAVALFLALLGMSRKAWFWTAVFWASFLLAFPTPISQALAKMPLFSATTATRILVLTVLAGSILAAYGLEAHFSRRAFWILSIPLVASFVAFGISRYILIHSSSASSLTIQISNITITMRNLVLPLVFLASAATIKLLNTSFNWSLILLVILELFRFGWKYNPFFDSRLVFPKTPIIEFLQANSPNYRIDGGDVIPPNLWIAYGLSSSSGYDAVYPKIWASYLSALEGGDVNYPKGRTGSILQYNNSTLLDLAGIKYITALKRNNTGDPDLFGNPRSKFLNPKFKEVFSEKNVAVLENIQALPQYSLVSSTRILPSDSEIIHFLSPGTAISSDPKFPVFSNPSNGKILNFFSPHPEQIILQTTSTWDTVLLNTQNYYPGWKAIVDGQPSKIYRTNYAFQSVFIPAGKHQVIFTYSPLSYKIGKYISLATIAFLAGVAFFRKRWTFKLNPQLGFTKMFPRTGMNPRSRKI